MNMSVSKSSLWKNVNHGKFQKICSKKKKKKVIYNDFDLDNGENDCASGVDFCIQQCASLRLVWLS